MGGDDLGINGGATVIWIRVFVVQRDGTRTTGGGCRGKVAFTQATTVPSFWSASVWSPPVAICVTGLMFDGITK